MKKILKILLMLSAVILFITACTTSNNENTADSTSSSGTTNSEQIKVVTSIFPMYEIVKEVAGDRAEVSLMVGANEDAHHYEPSAQAVASVNEADIFVYSSEVMEFWADPLLDVVENENLQIVEFGEGLNLEIEEINEVENSDDHNHNHDHDHDHDHGGLDPHFWLDLSKVNQQLPMIVEALAAADPEGTTIYEENAEAFSGELSALDKNYQEAFTDAEERIFVVQHQAFGHLANRYDLEQVAVGGLSTEIEPSPQTLVEIIQFVNEQNVPVIYYQSGNNSAVAETIADETNTEIAVLHDLESQPADIDTNEESAYLEAMAQNLEQLKKSIQ